MICTQSWHYYTNTTGIYYDPQPSRCSRNSAHALQNWNVEKYAAPLSVPTIILRVTVQWLFQNTGINSLHTLACNKHVNCCLNIYFYCDASMPIVWAYIYAHRPQRDLVWGRLVEQHTPFALLRMFLNILWPNNTENIYSQPKRNCSEKVTFSSRSLCGRSLTKFR